MTKEEIAAKNGKQQTANTPAVQAEKSIADLVLTRVKAFTANQDIRLPDNYSAENALKSAWLILLDVKDRNGNAALQVCDKASVANALLSMVLQGLNPVKKQCDFLVYGDKLTLQREYHGTIALAKRYADLKEAVGTVVYEGDIFDYEIQPDGYKRVIEHKQAFDNIDMNKIKGAYATLIFNDPQKQPYTEIMTIAQIRQSWQQGATKGASPAHKNFPDQMCIKTVISRACKLFISSSDDSSLFDDDDRDERSQQSRQAIADNANKEEITMDIQAEVLDSRKPEPVRQPEPAEETRQEAAPVNNEPAKIPGF